MENSAPSLKIFRMTFSTSALYNGRNKNQPKKNRPSDYNQLALHAHWLFYHFISDSGSWNNCYTLFQQSFPLLPMETRYVIINYFYLKLLLPFTKFVLTGLAMKSLRVRCLTFADCRPQTVDFLTKYCIPVSITDS